MNIHHCDFCGAVSSHFSAHGLLVCSECKSGIPEEETDDQDLFDDDDDFHSDHSLLLTDLVLQA